MQGVYYTTFGPVRGTCGHRHKTIGRAEECRKADARGCASQGGYSDRFVVRVPSDMSPSDLYDGRILVSYVPADYERPQIVDHRTIEMEVDSVYY